MRLMLAALALLAVTACKSRTETTNEAPLVPSASDDVVPRDEDCELYWYQRGADATRAVWSVYRASDESALLRSVKISDGFQSLVADLFTYVITAIQMTLNHGQSVAAFVDFMTNYAVTQIPLAIIEGILFFMFATYLINNKPELLDITVDSFKGSKKKEASA